MIKTFGDQRTADVYNGVSSAAARRMDAGLLKVVRRKLDMLNAAADLRDLTSPPANRLEALKGDLKGKYSIRVNDQWRIVFRWEAGYAHEVLVDDYH